jgi:hypothetical protein
MTHAPRRLPRALVPLAAVAVLGASAAPASAAAAPSARNLQCVARSVANLIANQVCLSDGPKATGAIQFVFRRLGACTLTPARPTCSAQGRTRSISASATFRADFAAKTVVADNTVCDRGRCQHPSITFRFGG